ncbi:MAG: hypothetical protein IJ560_03410 [Alphaproteobacteria bacterium]|nr:hypothetical protein [Alphaproteobacteria bacterium]
MKKVLCILLLVLLVVLGYWFCKVSKTPDAQDLAVVDSVIPGSTFVRVGPAGDFLVKTPVTPELRAIASKARTTEFLSATIADTDLSDEYVFINVVPNIVLQNQGIGTRCFYRVFFGTMNDLAREKYAVELCEK